MIAHGAEKIVNSNDECVLSNRCPEASTDGVLVS